MVGVDEAWAQSTSATEHVWLGRLLAFAGVTALALVPFYLGDFKVELIGLGLTYGLFAFGLDLAWGRVGIISIGHAVFFGFGAYGVAIAQAHDTSSILGAGLGVIARRAGHGDRRDRLASVRQPFHHGGADVSRDFAGRKGGYCMGIDHRRK